MKTNRSLSLAEKIALKSVHDPVSFGLVVSNSLVFWSSAGAKDLLIHQLGDEELTAKMDTWGIARTCVLPFSEHPEGAYLSGNNALTRDPAFGLEFLDEFQDELMFGTDSCKRSDVDRTRMTVATLRDLRENRKRSAETLEKIEWRNAMRLLRLNERSAR